MTIYKFASHVIARNEETKQSKILMWLDCFVSSFFAMTWIKG